jgi:hypothetical protein
MMVASALGHAAMQPAFSLPSSPRYLTFYLIPSTKADMQSQGKDSPDSHA